MEIKVELKPNIDDLISRFKGFESILVTKLKEGVVGYAALVERGSKIFSPVDTGTMRSSIGVTYAVNAGGLSAYVGPWVNYAIYVHEGTRYMKGRPFMEWGLNAYRDKGDTLIIQKINEAVKILANK